MPSKSIFRQPGAKHFQLVHRSQRDPLINDPEASDRVLKPFERDNAKKGKSRVDLETALSAHELNDVRENTGEASLYGVYFDDSEYDYMRHLRPVGVQEDGVESILIEAPSTSAQKSKNRRKNGIELLDLPEGVLASTSELPRTYESQQAVPASISGFQPDMDAHLRQVLEALEDDEFVDDELDDDFFDQLVADGERASDEEVDFNFIDEAAEGSAMRSEDLNEEDGGWEQKFANFKKTHSTVLGSDDGYDSEGGDTVGTLPAMSVISGKGKRRRKGTSDASGYSMSSSSMFRNETLQTLDERFDQMILKQYNEDDEDKEESGSNEDGDSDEAPELITSRDDFDSMVNTFLNDYEILGRKMKPRMEGESGLDKLDSLRRAMGQDERVRIMNGENEEVDDEKFDAHLFPSDDDKKDRWDCETILTTYTNLENHPRLIRARDLKPGPKIMLDRKTGLPSVLKTFENTKPSSKTNKVSFGPASEGDNDSDSDDGTARRQAAVGRPRDESKEEKKARKAAVKAERQTRRAEKKSTKEQFGSEVKDQKKRIVNKELRLKKL